VGKQQHAVGGERARSHVRQNGSVVDAMMPNVSRRAGKRSAGAEDSSPVGVIAPRSVSRSTSLRVKRQSPVRGAADVNITMKRTSAPASRPTPTVDQLVVVVTARDDGVDFERHSQRCVPPRPADLQRVKRARRLKRSR
jgi:hypothetical protein